MPMPTRRPLVALVRRFVFDETGGTAIEYAMVAAGVGGVVAVSIYALGDTVADTFYNRLAQIIAP